MKKKHKGFTLTEVMIAISIIGVIMVFYIPVKKTVTNLYTTLGYFAYNNVSAISKELIAGKNIDVGGTQYNSVETTTINGMKELILTTNDEVFCQLAVDVANTVGSNDCSSLKDASGTSISGFNAAEPTFITTNSHRYYLSKRATDSTISTTYGYRVMSVDVNGKRVPNAIASNTSKRPGDIISFLIFDNGEVVPIGEAANNRNYINARVKTYMYNGGSPDNKNICQPYEKSGAMTTQCPFDVGVLEASNGETTMGYREAYCMINGSSTHLAAYNCGEAASVCPLGSGTDKVDSCELFLVKPVYRIKM